MAGQPAVVSAGVVLLKANAAVIGRLMNNVKMGYYPTDPDNISLILRGIRFPEGVTTNLLDPCCGCGKALRQLAQGNNCYAYGMELDESRAASCVSSTSISSIRMSARMATRSFRVC